MRTFGTQTIQADGMLSIGGCRADELAGRFGTPLYVVDEALLRDSCRRYLAAARASYSDAEVSYASKANCSMAICRIVHDEGLSVDVASRGELMTALAAGVPSGHVVLHGNNKQPDDIRLAVARGIGLIVADWMGELEMIEEVGAELGCKVPILLRLAPGVDPDTHEAIRTGQADTKFGLSILGDAGAEGVRCALGLPHVDLKGYHCHVGSQLCAMSAHVEAVEEIARFAGAMAKAHGYQPAMLDVGGGLGVHYTVMDEPPTFEEFNKRIGETVNTAVAMEGLPLPKLMQEPGRSLVAEAGLTLYTVGAVKPVQLPGGDVRTYVSVDGGLSDNPRPQLYGARYDGYLANRVNDQPDLRCRIAGAHCETDTLIADILLPAPRPGDLMAVPCTGAYCYSMASNYNRFVRPAVVLVSDGDADVIVEREGVEDVLRQDRLPERLGG